MMLEDAELELLLELDGAVYEAASGWVVEFSVRRTDVTAERPHGISYALVFREAGGKSIVRFDNAHAVTRPGGRFVQKATAYDHWHRNESDTGRPYAFTSAMRLLDDFWTAVKQAMDERGIPNDL